MVSVPNKGRMGQGLRERHMKTTWHHILPALPPKIRLWNWLFSPFRTWKAYCQQPLRYSRICPVRFEKIEKDEKLIPSGYKDCEKVGGV